MEKGELGVGKGRGPATLPEPAVHVSNGITVLLLPVEDMLNELYSKVAGGQVKSGLFVEKTAGCPGH